VGLKSACCLQARRNFGNADRPPEAVALHGVHPGRTQEQLLVGRFDAFGGDLHSEATAEADDRVHDRGGIGCGLDGSRDVAGLLELLEAGSEVEAKRRGWVRVEGRDYVVKDGDTLNVRFNV